jgi:hypothetical protein
MIDGGFRMNAAELMAKLVEIERAVGWTNPVNIRAKVIEAEESLLQLEQQMIETLRENARLRERMESCGRSYVSRITEDDADLMELSGPLGVRRIPRDAPFTIN